MKPTFIEKDQIILTGLSFFGDPFGLSAEWTEENEIGRLWNRLFSYLADNSHRIQHIKQGQTFYEVHIQHAETTAKGHFEIFVGLEIKKAAGIPVELLVKVLPPTRYAVFTLKGAEIPSDWPQMIYQEWLPTSGYQEAFPYNFQLYDHRFKGLENVEESVIDVYVPITSAR